MIPSTTTTTKKKPDHEKAYIFLLIRYVFNI